MRDNYFSSRHFGNGRVFVFSLLKFLVRMSGSLSYQPTEVQKVLECHFRHFILLVSENAVTENIVVVKEVFIMT